MYFIWLYYLKHIHIHDISFYIFEIHGSYLLSLYSADRRCLSYRRATSNTDVASLLAVILSEFKKRNIDSKVEFFDFYRSAVVRNEEHAPGDYIHYLHSENATFWEDTNKYTGTLGKHIVNVLLQFLCPGL